MLIKHDDLVWYVRDVLVRDENGKVLLRLESMNLSRPDITGKGKPLTASAWFDENEIQRRCLDDGTCHHYCKLGECLRESVCDPLAPFETWDEVRACY